METVSSSEGKRKAAPPVGGSMETESSSKGKRKAAPLVGGSMETVSSSRMKSSSRRKSASPVVGSNDVWRAAPISAATAAAATDAAASVPPLSKILAVLKRLLYRVMSTGLLPSLEEIKLSNLIWSHVTSYIFIYQRESYSKFLLNDRRTWLPDDEEELERTYKDTRLFNLHKILGVEDYFLSDQPLGDFLSEKFFEHVFYDLETFSTLLEDCRSSFKETKAPHLLEVACPGSCHVEQQLLEVLHALEKVGSGRGYAPPQSAADLRDYREIRKLASSFIAYSCAKYDFLKKFGKAEDLAGCDWFSTSEYFPFDMELKFISSGHKIASALELISECKLIFSKCEGQLSNIFRATEGDKQVTMGADDGGSDTENYILPHVRVPQLSEEEIRDFRLKSLREILSLCAQLASCRCRVLPTTSEVRSYLHILEHVHSSLWLATQIQSELPRSPIVSLRNHIDSRQLPSLSTPGDEMTRKECILNICKLVDAIKFQCFASMMPTMEETKLYKMISKLLNPDLMVCTCLTDEDVKIVGMLDKGLEVTGMMDKYLEAVVNRRGASFSRQRVAHARHYLACCTYMKEMQLLEELKKTYLGIVDVICCTVIPEEWNAKPSSSRPLHWVYESRDKILPKMSDYFQKPGKPEKLDQAIVTLNGANYLMNNFSWKLWDATSDTREKLLVVKRYDVILREVGNAAFIYGSPYDSGHEAYGAAGIV